MATEIERKFLLKYIPIEGMNPDNGVAYIQGYLNTDKNKTVRVRIAGNDAFLTIKGTTSGISRQEFEYKIPLNDAQEMISMCDDPIIKVRWKIPYGGLIWEVDQFCGSNTGLILAEVELTTEDQVFENPPWIGQEVSNDPRYYNSNLATNPYTTWDNNGN